MLTGVTRPRIVVPGATLAITRRTVLRKAFLGDWDPRVSEGFLYCLAHAANKYRATVHIATRVVSHHHLDATFDDANWPDFLQLFHRELSAFINALLAANRYDMPSQVFDGEQAHAMRLLDAAAQLGHLVYEHLNPVAAGLVSRPVHMPGTVLNFRMWNAGGLMVKKPDVYFGDDRPDELWLPMGPPPYVTIVVA